MHKYLPCHAGINNAQALRKQCRAPFISASFQTSGKGRNDRIWLAESNQSLLFSYLIKDEKLLAKFKSISIGTATLIARFLELKGIKNVSVKWPNDVYVNEKKICGILLEGNVEKYLVIGAGLNVNQTIFEGEYRITPTSMKNELNKTFSLDELKNELFPFIYKHVNQTGFESNTFRFLNTHNYLENKKVEINGISGVVTGFARDFSLIIDGKNIDSGEITILGD